MLIEDSDDVGLDLGKSREVPVPRRHHASFMPSLHNLYGTPSALFCERQQQHLTCSLALVTRYSLSFCDGCRRHLLRVCSRRRWDEPIERKSKVLEQRKLTKGTKDKATKRRQMRQDKARAANNHSSTPVHKRVQNTAALRRRSPSPQSTSLPCKRLVATSPFYQAGAYLPRPTLRLFQDRASSDGHALKRHGRAGLMFGMPIGYLA
jgi:hypothetical protein